MARTAHISNKLSRSSNEHSLLFNSGNMSCVLYEGSRVQSPLSEQDVGINNNSTVLARMPLAVAQQIEHYLPHGVAVISDRRTTLGSDM